MTWEEGNQKRNKKERDINKFLKEHEGFLDEKEAKLLLYEFLRENTTINETVIATITCANFVNLKNLIII